MPYKKKSYRRRFRRRPYRRKKRSSTAVQRNAGISDSQIVKLRYADMVRIDSVAGVADGNVWSANSIFDPNRTGVGHQPLGHDEWQLFYNHATVLGSKITATFMPTSSDVILGNSCCSIKVMGNNTLDTNIYSTLEQTGSSWKLLGNSAAAGKGVTITKYFSAKKFFGVTDVKDADNLRGTFGANPADEAYFHVQHTGLNGTDNPAAVDVVVTIEYICLLSERRQLLIS